MKKLTKHLNSVLKLINPLRKQCFAQITVQTHQQQLNEFKEKIQKNNIEVVNLVYPKLDGTLARFSQNSNFLQSFQNSDSLSVGPGIKFVPDMSSNYINTSNDQKSAYLFGMIDETSSQAKKQFFPRNHLLQTQQKSQNNNGISLKQTFLSVEFYVFNSALTNLVRTGQPFDLAEHAVFGMKQMQADDFMQNCGQLLNSFGIKFNSFEQSGTHQFRVTFNTDQLNGDVLKIADQATLSKVLLRHIASKQFNVNVTFMAQPTTLLPGCNMNTEYQIQGVNNKEQGESFVNAVNLHFKEFLPFYFPNVNSYKKVNQHIGDRSITREMLVAPAKLNLFSKLTFIDSLFGADSNLYLMGAAVLSSGLERVPRMIKDIDRGCFLGEKHLLTLERASKWMNQSELVKRSLGEGKWEDVTQYVKKEALWYNTVVTGWEFGRYSDQV